MLASYHGHPELVKLLMRYGASPNVLNDRGQSPLAGAVFKKEDGVVEVCSLPSSSLLFFPKYEVLWMDERRGCGKGKMADGR